MVKANLTARKPITRIATLSVAILIACVAVVGVLITKQDGYAGGKLPELRTELDAIVPSQNSVPRLEDKAFAHRNYATIERFRSVNASVVDLLTYYETELTKNGWVKVADDKRAYIKSFPNSRYCKRGLDLRIGDYGFDVHHHVQYSIFVVWNAHPELRPGC